MSTEEVKGYWCQHRYNKYGGVQCQICSPQITVDSLPRVGGDILSPLNVGMRGQEVYHPSYGMPVTDSMLDRAVTREPLADMVTYGIAADIFGKWFTLDPPDLDAVIQPRLEELDARRIFINAAAAERKDGYSLIAMRIPGPLTQEPTGGEITQLEVYQKKYVLESNIIPYKESHDRYGMPELYALNRGGKSESGKDLNILINETRCIHVVTRTDHHVWKGKSLLETIWDDLIYYKNDRYAVSEVLWRAAIGPLVVLFPEGERLDKDQIKTILDEQIGDWTHRKTIGLSGDHKVQSLQVSPIPPNDHLNAILGSVAMGVRVPKEMFSGDIQGVKAAEIIERTYFSSIQNLQELYYTNFVKQLINKLIKHEFSGHTEKDKVKPYTVKWNEPFKLTQAQKAREARATAQAKNIMLNWMTVNEVRDLDGKKPITGGDILLPLEQLEIAKKGGFPFGNQSQQRR